jgi:hypothetical protein
MHRAHIASGSLRRPSASSSAVLANFSQRARRAFGRRSEVRAADPTRDRCRETYANHADFLAEQLSKLKL